METILSPGRHLWSVTNYDGISVVTDFTVTRFKQFLPAGPVAIGQPGSRDAHRQFDIVQVFTDKGLRTLAVADLRLKKPTGIFASNHNGGDAVED